VGTSAEDDGAAIKARQLRESQSGLNREQEQRVVTTAQPGCPIWYGQQRVDPGE
jgi:hypothetical protein